MGCAASQEDQPRERKRGKGRKDKKSKGEKGDKNKGAVDNGDDGGSVPPHTSSNPLHSPETSSAPRLLGKDKYIGDVGAVVMALENGTLVVSAPEDEGLVFAFRDNQGVMFVKEFQTDAQIELEKSSAGIDVPWGSFFKSIASDVLKCKAKVALAGANVQVSFTMTSSKDPKYSKAWSVRLMTIGGNPRDMHRFFLSPMSAMVQCRRSATGEALDKEQNFIRIETTATVASSGVVILRRECREMRDRLTKPREQVAAVLRSRYAVDLEISQLQRKVARAKGQFRGKELDDMYEHGGARFFLHLDHSPDHYPSETPVQETLVTAVREAFSSPPAGGDLVSHLSKVPTSPNVRRLLDANPNDRTLVEGMMTAMQRIDRWDYDVFSVDAASKNNALVYTTLAILEKLGLVSHFKLDLTTLCNFLSAVNSGYHPNPYHNATHAADVAQINYFIMTQGGLSEKCKLSKEELLAGVLAGSIHDYDHPGFNNNFHTRTNAYLSTLYNDRSILENHHCACVYEILRLPKYNIFAPLSDDQRREVRDTMLEMVLSTDMGNHAKIFGNFRRRQVEHAEGEWHEKDDRRLALSISIKMADISNCGRPTNLYLQWAKNIASEFYVQGDAEAALGLKLSPFMDRMNGATDFPNGQISFMKFIVIPMFEAISEFLPQMEFCLNHCFSNRDYWKRYEEM